MAWHRLTLALMLTLLATSCQSRFVQKLTKAKPASISPFLDKRQLMRPARERLPFHHVWRNTEVAVQMEVMRRTELFVAPVNLDYLKPVAKNLARWEMENGWTERDAPLMAQELRGRFESAFLESEHPRYRIVKEPGRRSLTLELAITELSPTCVRGNAVKTATGFLIGPLAGVLGVFTKGNLAIEGKVTISDTRVPVLQFSDNEKDKLTIYNARDFQPYAHALVSMKEWAAQFEEFTRTYSDHTVEESAFFAIRPW